MTSVFDDYLAGLDTQGAQYAPWGPEATPEEMQRSPRGRRLSGSGQWIKEGYAPSFTAIKQGSEAAAGLLRQAYEGKYRARAAGFAGGQAERERGYGSQMASQGFSPDVAGRMLTEQRVGGMQGLAEARGDATFGLDMDLAGLAKGTATEFAGLNRDQFAQIVNYIMGKKALQAGKNAALLQVGASLVGSAAEVGASAAAPAAAAPAASDPRLKKNAIVVGVAKFGSETIPVYEYEYIDPKIRGVYRGVMAPDVEHIEGVVHMSRAGFKYVDYMLLEKLTGFKFRKVASMNRSRRRARMVKV